MGIKDFKNVGAGYDKEGDLCHFRVWAPNVKNVHLHIIEPEARWYKMEHEMFGYWYVEVENCLPGTKYKFKPGDKNELPDPASLYQPDGVLGASETVDLKNHKWNDGGWKSIALEEMIFYELHTGTFTKAGDFEGIISRLDYLKELGINTIKLMPVGQFPGKRNWGYDVAYPFAVQQSYGGPIGLMKMVDACHQKGLAIVLDVIYNHLGPEGNYLGEYAPYFTNRFRTPWGKAVNYDDKYSDGVRNYVIQNARMWLEDFHFDGLRLDAVHAIYDFGAKHIMQELSEEVDDINRKTGRDHYLIAESGLNDSRYLNPQQEGGYNLDAQWNDDFHHGLHALVTGEHKGYYIDFREPGSFEKSFKHGYAYEGEYSKFRKRCFGNSSQKNPGKQFVVFSQNHDQVGNRKFGDRLRSLVSYEMLKTIAGAMFISPYLPMLFMGEEYGENNQFLYFVNHNDENLNELVRKGRRNEFKSFYVGDRTVAPDPAAEETFLKSKLTPDPLSESFAKTMFSFYQTLIGFKKKHPVLSAADKNKMNIRRENKFFIIERWQENSRILACLNFSGQHVVASMPESMGNGANKILDSSDVKWKGPGSNAPEIISANESFEVKNETIIIYSNQ